MKRISRIGLVVVSLVGFAAPAWAARMKCHEMAESADYQQKVFGMIGRGVVNAATCFVDPLVQTVNETKAGPALIGTLTGLARGTGCGVLRLGSGAIDVLTFWVPGFNGFPVSDSYDNCITTSHAAPPPPESTPEISPEEAPSSETGGAESQPAAPALPASPTKKVWKK